MQYSAQKEALKYGQWDIAYIGKAIDKRGETSINFTTENSSLVYNFNYIPNSFQIQIQEKPYEIEDIHLHVESTIHVGLKILLDATTLNFAEILLLYNLFKKNDLTSIDILYIEPADYRRKQKISFTTIDGLLHKRDFELSEQIIGYEAIPGFALTITREVTQKIVFICGFESERIDRLMEDSDVVSNNCCCIFGVPAFSPGWEMDSFDNNIAIIKDRKISGGVNFCGATNPLSVYDKLEEIYNGLEDDEQMFVVPLGTKPMGIGACIFLLEKPRDKVAVLYDHPTVMKGRALEIANWHLYEVIL